MTTRHHIILAALAALALGATAIPASARPSDLNSNGSYLPAQTGASSSTSLPPILPRVKASQITKLEQAEPQAAAHQPANGAPYSNAELSAYGTTAPPTVVRVSASNGGFDWGDAGIGAAAGIALSMIVVGGGLAASQRRARGSHRTALTN